MNNSPLDQLYNHPPERLFGRNSARLQRSGPPRLEVVCRYRRGADAREPREGAMEASGDKENKPDKDGDAAAGAEQKQEEPPAQVSMDQSINQSINELINISPPARRVGGGR